MKRRKITVVAFISACLFALGGLGACKNVNGGTSNNAGTDSSVMATNRDLSINVANEQLQVGDVLQIVASSANGETVTFRSTNEEVATVDAAGAVTAKAVGTAFILVTAGDAERTVKITVSQEAYVVSFTQTDIKLCVGTYYDVNAAITKDGNVYTDGTVTWTITADEGTLEDVVEYTSEGNKASLQTKAVGAFTVTATYGDVSATCKITVVNVNATALAAPTVTVADHDTLSWAAIDGAASYAVKVNNEQWKTTAETTFDLTSYADAQDSFTVQVKAVSARNNFDNYDSEAVNLTIAHDWDGGEAETVATCTTAADIVYTCTTCQREKEVAGHYGEHTYADAIADLYNGVTGGVYGICSFCGEYQSPAVNYAYDEETDSYTVVGVDTEKLALADGIVYVASKYDDGEHGEKAVTTIASGACAKVRSLRRVYLPDTVTTIYGSAFSKCSTLEWISMPGVTSIKSVTGKDFMNIFLDCSAIETVVVHKDFQLTLQCFYSRYNGEARLADVYVLGLADESDLSISGNNNVLSGEVYYLPRTAGTISCGEWSYEEGVIEGTDEHTYEDGVCIHCGTMDGCGLTYSYIIGKDAEGADIEGYAVTGLSDFEGTEVVVRETFNDGVHGLLPVVTVESYALSKNTVITKVILPESVTRIEDYAFYTSTALETVVMPGVISNAGKSKNYIGTNAFLDCKSLTSIVVGELWAQNTQIFLARQTGYTAQLDVFVTKAQSETSVQYRNWNETNGTVKQNMFTGNTYYYDAACACGTWKWDGGVYGADVVVQPAHDYSGTDGACKYCGAWNTLGIEYTYGTVTLAREVYINSSSTDTQQEFTGYIVTGLLSTHEGTTVNIPAEYNDGTNGTAKVLKINARAFRNDTTIEKVVLHRNVLAIGSYAFSGCTALKTMIMPGVISVYSDKGTGSNNIGENAFLNCISLETLVVGTLEARVTDANSSNPIFNLNGDYATNYTEGKIVVYNSGLNNYYTEDGTKAAPSGRCRWAGKMFVTQNQTGTTTPIESGLGSTAYNFYMSETEVAKGGYYLYSATAPTADDWATWSYWWYYDADGEIVHWTQEA